MAQPLRLRQVGLVLTQRLLDPFTSDFELVVELEEAPPQTRRRTAANQVRSKANSMKTA